MKDNYNNRIVTKMLFFFTLFSFAALYGCATWKPVSITTQTKNTGQKEILVVRDIGRGGDVFSPRWCGNNALLYKGDNIGIEMVDFITKERVRISDTRDDTALNCSPDGMWVLSESHGIIKTEKEGDMAFDEYVKKSSDVGTAARYIYRHEVYTGRKERVGVAGIDEGGSYEALSPDGKKLLLGNKHNLNTEIYVQEWEPVWFSNDGWERYDTRWFNGSSGVVHIGNNPNGICAEFFGDGGWARCFELDLKYKDNIYGLMLDREDWIYFQIGMGYLDASGIYSVYRCTIKDRELNCEEVAEERRGGSPVAILPEGDLIFWGDCILRAGSWQAQGECIADRWYGDIEYAGISHVGVSPDGRWLAFHRYRNELKTNNGWSVWTNDLFVIDIKDD